MDTATSQSWFAVRSAGEADAIAEVVAFVHDGWFPQGPIDWDDFIDRLDGQTLPDGRRIDMGDSLGTPAVAQIKALVRERRRTSP